MRFYTINAIAKGEYESVPDEQGMWVSRTAAEARIAQLQEALADALGALGYVPRKCRHGTPTDRQCVDCALSDDSTSDAVVEQK